MKNISGPKAAAILFAAVGIASLLGGAYSAFLQITFLSRSMEVKAVVVDFEMNDDGFLRPLVQFTDPKTGINVTAPTTIYRDVPDVSIGQEIDVLCDPENLSAPVEINSSSEIWFTPRLLLIAGTVFTAVGILALYLEIKKPELIRKREPRVAISKTETRMFYPQKPNS